MCTQLQAQTAGAVNLAFSGEVGFVSGHHNMCGLQVINMLDWYVPGNSYCYGAFWAALKVRVGGRNCLDVVTHEAEELQPQLPVVKAERAWRGLAVRPLLFHSESDELSMARYRFLSDGLAKICNVSQSYRHVEGLNMRWLIPAFCSGS